MGTDPDFPDLTGSGSTDTGLVSGSRSRCWDHLLTSLLHGPAQDVPAEEPPTNWR